VLLATIRDITDRKQVERMTAIRLDLIEFAATHSLAELLTRSLDIIGEMVHSPIGFYHFVEADQKTLSLQQWSTATLERFCTAAPGNVPLQHRSGRVWVDCVRQRQAVIHNDYRSLQTKKGFPRAMPRSSANWSFRFCARSRSSPFLGSATNPRIIPTGISKP
jgi:hypothetical protein